MTVSPLPGPRIHEVRAAARRQARTVSGVAVVVAGSALIALVMVAIVVLDYRLEQPVHRVVKLVMAAALALGVLLKPWLGMLAFPVIAPFLPWIPPVPIPGVNALNLLLGSVFAMWLIGRVMHGQPVARPSRLAVPIGLFMALIALSVVRGVAFPSGYDYDWTQGVVEAVRATVTMGVYFVALLMTRGERDRRALTGAVIVALVAEAAATMALGRNGRGARATGSIGQSNDLGAFLAMYTVVAAAMLPAARRSMGKLVLFASVVAGCAGIVLSVSRAAIVGVALGLFYVALRTSRTMTVVLLLVGATSPLWAPDFLKERMSGTGIGVEGSDDVELESGARLRVDTWRAIIRLVSDHPLDGVGFGGLQSVLPETGEALGVDVKDSSHNTYLRALSEMGIIGLAVFVWLLGRCFGLSRSVMRAARSRFDRQLGVGLGAATLVLAISCAFGDRFFNPLTVSGFWLLCGVAEDGLQEATRPTGGAA